MRGAIVLAGGPALRMGRPKPLIPFRGRPLVTHVADVAAQVADEVVVVSRGRLVPELVRVLPAEVRVLRDRSPVQAPVVGLIAGANELRSPLVAALACDLPLLRPLVVARLFEYARGRDAAIPRWPDGNVEPLVAVYRRSALAVAARATLRSRAYANLDLISRLRRVRYVSTETLRPLDPSLRSFTNVNTPEDLARAERW